MNIKGRIKQWLTGRSVKKRMARKLAELNYDFSVFSIESFTQTVAARKNRKIYFMAGPLPPGWSGCWVSISDPPRDYIVYAPDLHPVLQVHTQLHELSHILCDHPTLQRTFDEMRDLVQRGRLAELLQSALPRSLQTDVMEQEAETLAALIQLQAIRHAHLAELTVVPEEPQTVAFLRDIGAV